MSVSGVTTRDPGVTMRPMDHYKRPRSHQKRSRGFTNVLGVTTAPVAACCWNLVGQLKGFRSRELGLDHNDISLSHDQK